jgi:hypothetical protein
MEKFTLKHFETTKAYQYDLELVGGKMVLYADDMRRWFEGLWHGKSLAYSIGFITIIISYAFYISGNYINIVSKSDMPTEE